MIRGCCKIECVGANLVFAPEKRGIFCKGEYKIRPYGSRTVFS